jgi:hypothetical protein
MSQSRYIHLSGDPVAVNEPLKKTFYRADDFIGTLVAGGIAYGLNPEFKTGPDSLTSVFSVAESGAITMLLGRFTTKIIASRAQLEGKCIDTQPDKDAPPTGHKYALAAKRMQDMYRTLLMVRLGFDSVDLFTALNTHKNPGIALTNLALNATPYYTQQISGYRRFDRVINGKWMIVDMPTPEKLAEAAKTPEKKRGFSLFPKPA